MSKRKELVEKLKALQKTVCYRCKIKGYEGCADCEANALINDILKLADE
jgi:hypothetical protein